MSGTRDVSHRALDLPKDGAGVTVKQIAGFGRMNAARRSAEKLAPKSVLKLSDLLTEGWLRNVEVRGWWWRWRIYIQRQPWGSKRGA